MTLRDGQGTDQVEVENIKTAVRAWQILQRSSNMSENFGPLTGNTRAAETSDITGHAMPNKTPLGVAERGIGALVSEAVDALEDILDHGARNDRPGGDVETSQRRAKPEGKMISCSLIELGDDGDS